MGTEIVIYIIGGCVVAIFIILLVFFIVSLVGGKKEGSEPPYIKFASSAQKQANDGEKMVSDALKALIDKYGGYIYNNVCFVDRKGHSSEIDTLLVTRAGLFVIETKTMNGKIYGYFEEDLWVCMRPNNSGHREFPNPIIQNEGHVNHLKRMLKNKNVTIYSAVIFPISDLSHLNVDGVYTLNSAVKIIDKTIHNHSYSNEYLERLHKEIDYIVSFCSISKEQHVENIKRIYDR